MQQDISFSLWHNHVSLLHRALNTLLVTRAILSRVGRVCSKVDIYTEAILEANSQRWSPRNAWASLSTYLSSAHCCLIAYGLTSPCFGKWSIYHCLVTCFPSSFLLGSFSGLVIETQGQHIMEERSESGKKNLAFRLCRYQLRWLSRESLNLQAWALCLSSHLWKGCWSGCLFQKSDPVIGHSLVSSFVSMVSCSGKI